MGIDAVAEFARREGAIMDRYFTALRMPSISADKNFHDECQKCAEWHRSVLETIGLQNTTLLKTSTGKPVVYGEKIVNPNARTVLFYGHYDVQPAPTPFPEDEKGRNGWISDPFQPVERDGRIFARGAQDNKGQAHATLAALESVIEHGTLNCNVKVYLEGEEESKSTGIGELWPTLGDSARGDVLLVCDTGTNEIGTSGITLGLRGIVALEVLLGGLSGDLHSGIWGGKVKNPATELSRLLATLHNEDGSPAVSGFMDGVPELDDVMRAMLAASTLSDQKLMESTGVPLIGGERGFASVERAAVRPTIEVNGIGGGYQGEGGMTIIPKGAFAKLSARLVGRQDPEKCLEAIVRHLRERAPEGLTLDIKDAKVGGPALWLDMKSDLVKLAQEVLQASSGKPARFFWDGGSIPIVAKIARLSGAEPLLMGHGLNEDRIHQANESFALQQFALTYRGAVGLFERL